MKQQYAFTWRTLLAEIIRDPQEKQRLAEAMSVNPITLTRWASAQYNINQKEEGDKHGKPPRPQLQSLRKLITALPEYRDALLPSILNEFQGLAEEDFLSPLSQNTLDGPSGLPAICYEQVLEAAATFSGVLRFTTVFDYLLDYAVLQLDPERLGLWISVLQCTSPPIGHKVRSMRELFRVGTPPWRREPEERNFYLGAGSLTGYAMTNGRSYVIDDTSAYAGWPPMLFRENNTNSLAACPIWRTGHIAGVLLFGATQPKYFTKERMQLIEKYSCLAQVAFDDSNAYAQENIELRLMPDFEKQKPVLHLFNKRVEKILAKGAITDRMEAERIVARQIEDDFIFLSTYEGSGTIPSEMERHNARRV